MTKPPARKAAAKKSSSKKPNKAPASPQALVRAMMRQFEKRMGPNELITPEDLNAMLTSLSAPQASDRLDDEAADARAEAQDLAFRAMESSSEAQARKLVKRALRLDPDCVDALLILNELDAQTTQEMMEGLRRAVAAGERALGAEFIAEQKGQFWLLLETRPYMRALWDLASVYRMEGMRVEATGAYERMLELNPNDNQGVRNPLLGLYLSQGDLAGAGKLLKKYERDASANFAWGRVLERFLAGDHASARAVLKKARKVNRFVELYLTGQRPIPEAVPAMYTPGSEEEAILCMDHAGMAWVECKQAIFWLLKQCAADGRLPAAAKRYLDALPPSGKMPK